MSPLEKLILKKKEQGSMMDPIEQKAKMSNLEALRDEMSGMMKGDLQPKAKVEIASDSPEGLKMGLDKAKDVVEGSPEVEGSADGMEEDKDAISDDDASAGDIIGDQIKHEGSEGDLSPEEIDQLQMLLSKLKQSKVGA